MLIARVIDFSFSKIFLQDCKILGSIYYLPCNAYMHTGTLENATHTQIYTQQLK